MELKQRVVEAVRSAEYPDYLTTDEWKLATLIEQLAASLAEVIAGFTVEGDAALGGSKIGGRPDLPADVAWPHAAEGGGPLAFVCQLNLAELAPHDAQGRLPDHGHWYLFSVCDSDAAYGGEIDENTTAVLHLASPGPLAARDFPEALPSGARLLEKPLRFVPSLICETFDAQRGLWDEPRFDYAIEQAMKSALTALGSRPAQLRALAHPCFFHRDFAELYDHERELELLGFAGNIASGQFGEGEFHVLIDQADLARGELGNARVVFEPGT